MVRRPLRLPRPASFLTAYGNRRHVDFDVAAGADGLEWSFSLAAPYGARLVVGHRYVVTTGGVGGTDPNLVVGVRGVVCYRHGGSFRVRSARWDRRGRIVSFAASFAFTCGDKTVARGSFSFRREYFRSAFPGA